MDIPGFAKDGNDLYPRVNQASQIFISIWGFIYAMGAAKGCDFGSFKVIVLYFLKKALVCGIGGRPASFNIVYSQFI